MPLSNRFSNRLDDFVNSSDNKNVLSRCQKRNVITSRLLAIWTNGVASHSKIEEKAAGSNRASSHSRIELGIKSTNSDLLDIRFSIKEK